MEKDVKINPNGRCISSKHLDAYKNGILKKLLMAIKDDLELSLEMRRENEAILYYRKGKVLTTRLKKGSIEVEMLSSQYYKNMNKPSINIEDPANLISKGKIQKYIKEAKQLVLYKDGEEFTFQQRIATGNHSFDNKYLVVDMEWEYPQGKIKKEDRIDTTRPDFVIVDTEKNTDGYNDIYLAELKVGTGATQGPSGIIDHVDKTNNIIENKDACMALVNDVKSIIANKIELGLIYGQPKELHFANKPKMMLISVYRGEKERIELDQEAQKACERAREIKMEEPKCLLYNAYITIEG